jgi:hypothetical protein
MIGATLGIRISVNGNSGRALNDSARAGRNTERTSTGAARGLNLWSNAARQTGRSMGVLGRGLSMARGSAASFSKGISGAIGNLFSLKNMIIGVFALAAGGSLFDKLIGSNAKLQSQQLGLAATLNANLVLRDAKTGKELTGGAGFMAAQKVSKDLQKQFEKDALTAPGSSSELAMIFQSGLNPALQAGKSVDEMRVIAKEAMTFSKIIGNDIPQAARDIQLLFNGTAGMDNRTWQMLGATVGLTAEQFNKLPKAERFDRLKKAMQQFATPDVINAYAGSWDGLTSSMGDLIDQTTRTIGAPVFRELSGLLKEAVGWMTNPVNKKGIDGFAKSLGLGIVGAVRTVVRVIPQMYDWFKKTFAFIGKIINSTGFRQFIGLITAKIQFLMGLPWGEWVGKVVKQISKLTSSKGFLSFSQMIVKGINTVLSLPFGTWIAGVFDMVSRLAQNKDVQIFARAAIEGISSIFALPWGQWISGMLTSISKLTSSQGFQNFAQGIVNAIREIISTGKKVIAFYVAHKKMIDSMAAGIAVAVAGFYAVSAAITVARIAMGLFALNPVTLAIAALALGIGLLINHFGGVEKSIQKVTALPWAEWLNTAIEAVKPFVGWLVSGYMTLANDLIPIIGWFGKQIESVFSLFNQWLTENKEMLDEAGEGLKVVGGWVTAVRDAIVKLTVRFAGFVALGVATIFTGIAAAVIFVLSKVRAFAAFITSIPNRIQMAVNDMKTSFLGLGLELTKMVKQIPILGQLFGAVDIGTGLSKSIENQIQQLKNANKQTALELRAVDPSNPKAQTQAQKELQRQGERNLEQTSNVTINNTQNISTADPTAAANAANRGVSAVVKKAVTPTTSQARRGQDAITQMAGA